MRTAFLTLLATVFLVVAGGCSDSDSCNDSTVSRVDSTVDFAGISTFAILPETNYPDDLPDDLPEDVQTNLDTANDAVRDELLALGLTEVGALQDPDVNVFSLAATESESGVVWDCVPGYVWWGYWGFVWDSCAWLAPIVVTYGTGTVVVGLADPVEQKAVFGGVIQGVLQCGEDVDDRIRAGVSRIFDDYPVPPPS